MGYSTDYDINITGALVCHEEVADKLSEISGYDFSEGLVLYDRKWYNHSEDMKTLSKLYPDNLFIVDGIGEEYPDIWRKYYRNGVEQVSKAQIVFNECEI